MNTNRMTKLGRVVTRGLGVRISATERRGRGGRTAPNFQQLILLKSSFLYDCALFYNRYGWNMMTVQELIMWTGLSASFI